MIILLDNEEYEWFRKYAESETTPEEKKELEEDLEFYLSKIARNENQ